MRVVGKKRTRRTRLCRKRMDVVAAVFDKASFFYVFFWGLAGLPTKDGESGVKN
jgi:hypothetical protein